MIRFTWVRATVDHRCVLCSPAEYQEEAEVCDVLAASERDNPSRTFKITFTLCEMHLYGFFRGADKALAEAQ